MSSELASGKLIVDEPADHVVRIKISNPDKRGALDHEILDTLAVTIDDLDARCLILTGDGPVFSAGYDIGNLEGADFEDNAEKLVAHPFTEAIEAIERYRYPVVAAINGHAIGGGLELAVSCDLRIAARGVKLGMPPAKLGLIYSHTGLKKFIEVCGVANTNELFYLGRNVDADRGLRDGARQPGRRARRARRAGAARRARDRRQRAAVAVGQQDGHPRVARAPGHAAARASRPSSSSCARAASAPRTSARA